jgi:hypothetical protein
MAAVRWATLMADPERPSVVWSSAEAAEVRLAVDALPKSEQRDVVLARCAKTRRDGSVNVRLKPTQVALVTTALEARPGSRVAMRALQTLRAAVLKHVAESRRTSVAPEAQLANPKAATRDHRARHLTGRKRPGR